MEPRRGFIFGLAAVAMCILLQLDQLPKIAAVRLEDLVRPSDYDIEPITLALGDITVERAQLQTHVHLYGEVYETVYVNTNGILTFDDAYPDFLNQPLPIEYAAIAPFYSNIDTSAANLDETSITYFESNDSRLLRHLEASLYGAFPTDMEFNAIGAFIVTWTNVGRFDAKNDQLNTFQTVIVSSDDKTYVQFLYPRDGLNWIQADIGLSGLVDVRAQAGFVSADGRYFKLPGSGTDNSKYLDKLSNYDEEGSWWFLVGPIEYPNEIILPHNDAHLEGLLQPASKQSCATHALTCHVTARCEDTATGFCCHCRDGYYGNGFTCLKADAPIRVSGRLAGQLNGVQFSTQLQAYVSLQDGQTFAAITPLEPEIGQQLQLLQLLAAPIGWLFALPQDGARNGYQLTGGKFNHTSQIRFHGDEHEISVTQQYVGMNVWDQLEVNVQVDGSLPSVAEGSLIAFPDIVEEFVYKSERELRSIGTLQVTLNSGELLYTLVQLIEFEKCPHAERETPFTELPRTFNRVFKVTSAYSPSERALRIGMFNKVTLNRDSNACTDGSAQCGENTVCMATANGSYDCICKNGFLPSTYDQHSCVDIDECADSKDICDPNAICSNQPGGYTCQCDTGFIGNGYKCTPDASNAENEIVPPAVVEQHQPAEASSVATEQEHEDIDVTGNPEENETEPEWHECPAGCSSNAECVEYECQCRPGFLGDGITCEPACDEYSQWSNDRCVPLDTPTSIEDVDEEEVSPFCHLQGCTCPTGYDLELQNANPVCRKVPIAVGAPSGQVEEEKLPCDVMNDCNPNARCEFIETVYRHKCVCQEGFVGDGYECVEQEVSCTIENNCHEQAMCLYDETLGMSVCRCDKGYEGDGKHCEPEPECRHAEQCGDNAQCTEAGVCECSDGYEKGQGDLCILAGSCGGAYCAENAICLWDSVEQLSYCECQSGYQGDGVRRCEYVPPPCNVINNCGLNAACAPDYRNPALYQCVCNGGFNGDGFHCTPEENCQNTPSLCHPSATCISTTTGLQCACNNGFVGNGSYCSEPPRFDSDFLLLSRGQYSIRVPLSGRRSSQPVMISNFIMSLDKDCTQGRVYWSDLNDRCIMSATYDGRDKRPFINTDIKSPEGVAVDWISRRLYWTDSQKDTVEVASLDDPSVRSVVARNLVNPRGIAVDPHQNKIYWSDWNRNAPKIEWANLDGSEREVLLTYPQVRLPNHVAISPRTRDLCFVDAETKRLDCIDTQRKTVYTVAANLSYPFGLAITDTQFYWTDWSSNRIETADHADNRLAPMNIPIFSNHRMYGLTAITDDCPLFYSACQVGNGGCPADRLCLANQRAPGGRTCKCVETAENCTDEDYYQ